MTTRFPTTTAALMDVSARIYSRTQPAGDCLVWTGQTNEGGYGQIGWRGTNLAVHRVTYTAMKGPIEPGLHIDHL
jgi:hypothetical protein